MKIWLNGELVESGEAKISVLDHGVLYGDGVFEGIRIYNGRIFRCEAHVERFFRSAAHIRLKMQYTQEELCEAMYRTLRANGLEDGYIRLVATRGEGTLGLSPFNCTGATTFIIASTIQLYPKEMYEFGIPVIVAKTRRTSASMLPPFVKSLNYLNNILAKIESIDAGVQEAIMLNDRGEVAEATGDNIFIVRDGRVITPPPEAGILLGITRNVVLELCRRLEIDHAEQTIQTNELYTSDECFLTGTAAEVIAVTHIDGRQVGNGKAGPITTRLLDAFHEFIRSNEG